MREADRPGEAADKASDFLVRWREELLPLENPPRIMARLACLKPAAVASRSAP